jgi:hypothetical protein
VTNPSHRSRAVKASQTTVGLEEHRDWRLDAGDLPLQLTEERIRAESQRARNAEPIENVSLVAVSPPRETHTPLHDSASATGSLPLQPAPPVPDRAATYGSVLRLNAGPLREHPGPVVPVAKPYERRCEFARQAGRSRGLWRAVIALTLALSGETAYGYLAIRRDCVIVPKLPGASVVRTIGAETKDAQSQLRQSKFSSDVPAIAHKARPALTTVYQGAQRLASEVRGRYAQWRGR